LRRKRRPAAARPRQLHQREDPVQLSSPQYNLNKINSKKERSLSLFLRLLRHLQSQSSPKPPSQLRL
jgi:hypothetical protein